MACRGACDGYRLRGALLLRCDLRAAAIAALGYRENYGRACHRMRQTLEGSFSALSKPTFASKYAFESYRQDLHDALLRAAPKSHFFQKMLEVCQKIANFDKKNHDIAERFKGLRCVGLGKSFQMHI